MVKHTIDSAQLAKKLDYFSDNFDYFESHAISYGFPQKGLDVKQPTKICWVLS